MYCDKQIIQLENQFVDDFTLKKKKHFTNKCCRNTFIRKSIS